MIIVEASKENFEKLVEMGVALWPDISEGEIRKTFSKEMSSMKHMHFLAQSDDGEYIAFANLSLRSDYVEGSETSPVGYLEGIYVKARFRKQGVARALVDRSISWARSKGCSEFGSDTELTNTASQKFHEKIGFEVADRAVHYIRDI